MSLNFILSLFPLLTINSAIAFDRLRVFISSLFVYFID